MLKGLSAHASQLLGRVQRNTAPISDEVQQKLSTAAQANEGKPLTAAQVEKILVGAMPDQKSVISDCKSRCVGKVDGGTFLSQILEHRIEKENMVLHVNPAVTRRRDPLYANFGMDPKASAMLLFNARDIDEKGRPLLMKVVAREGCDVGKLDLSQYRTKWSEPDVISVKKNADYVEIKDVNEEEFAFGDPLLQVSTNAKGGEISRSVAVRPANVQITTRYNPKPGTTEIDPNSPVGAPQRNVNAAHDREGVVTFRDRLHMDLKAKADVPEGAWLDTKVSSYDIALGVDRGLIYEPDSTANITFMQTALNLAVPADDADLLGSDAARTPLKLHPNYANAWTLQQLVTQNVNLRTQSGGGSADAKAQNIPIANLLHPSAGSVTVASSPMKPLADTALNAATFEAAGVSATKVPLPDDPESDGQRVCIDLDKGFLGASDDASVKGWKVVAGYTDQSGKWQSCGSETISNHKNSQAMHLTVDVHNAKHALKNNRSIELRVFNDCGVPAQRVNVPLRDINWSDSAL